MKRTLLATTAAAVLGLSTTLAAAQSTVPDTGAPEKHAQPGTPGKAPSATTPGGNTGQTMQGHPAGTPNAQLQEPSGPAPKGQHPKTQAQEQQPSGATPKGQPHMNSQLQQQQEPRSGQPKAQQQLQQGQLQQQQNREVNQPSAPTGSVNQPNRQPSQTAQPQTTQPSQNTQTRTQTSRVPPAQITEQQRTQIHERISHESLHRVDQVNFSISVGTVVPRTVVLYQLPPAIVEIVPEYSGYEYVVVGDELLIIDPVSLQIVAVLPV
jgi:hypothetical protein